MRSLSWRPAFGDLLARICATVGLVDRDVLAFARTVFDDSRFCGACLRSARSERGELPVHGEEMPLHLMIVAAREAHAYPALQGRDKQIAALAGLFHWSGFVLCADPHLCGEAELPDPDGDRARTARTMLVLEALCDLEATDARAAGTLWEFFGVSKHDACDHELLEHLIKAVRQQLPDIRALWTWEAAE